MEYRNLTPFNAPRLEILLESFVDKRPTVIVNYDLRGAKSSKDDLHF